MILRKEVYTPVANERQERTNRRLLVNTFLNKKESCLACLLLLLDLDAVKMVIEGEAPVEILDSKKKVSEASKEKRPFSFIARSWEVNNPTD